MDSICEKMRVLKVLVLFFFLCMGSVAATLVAGDVTFFGPGQYTRSKGKPVTESHTFACPVNYTGTGFTMRSINGDSVGKHRVSSAVITFNGKRYVYWWADGVYFNIRMESDRNCILVLIGVLSDGTKELLAVEEGPRESELSWQNLLLRLKRRGLNHGPLLAIGDGAPGFWNAIGKAYPDSRHQRCWVHKTANVLDKLPKSVQPEAKGMIHEIYMSADKENALKAFDDFVAFFEAKYPKATHCLLKDKDQMLRFYDFPAEHWRHIRSTNVIESTFATVRLRTYKTKGCLSRKTALTMVLAYGTQKNNFFHPQLLTIAQPY
jgi:transposase-like protein